MNATADSIGDKAVPSLVRMNSIFAEIITVIQSGQERRRNVDYRNIQDISELEQLQIVQFMPGRYGTDTASKPSQDSIFPFRIHSSRYMKEESVGVKRWQRKQYRFRAEGPDRSDQLTVLAAEGIGVIIGTMLAVGRIGYRRPVVIAVIATEFKKSTIRVPD